jgi:hypothetical protein
MHGKGRKHISICNQLFFVFIRLHKVLRGAPCPHQIRVRGRQGHGQAAGQLSAPRRAKQRANIARAEAVRPAIAETAHLSMRAVVNELNRRGLMMANGQAMARDAVDRVRQHLGL